IAAQTGDYSFAQISGSVGNSQLPAAGGDLNGTLTAAKVTGLQSRPVGVAVPVAGQVLAWDGGQWAPQTFAGGGCVRLRRYGSGLSSRFPYSGRRHFPERRLTAP